MERQLGAEPQRHLHRHVRRYLDRGQPLGAPRAERGAGAPGVLVHPRGAGAAGPRPARVRAQLRARPRTGAELRAHRSQPRARHRGRRDVRRSWRRTATCPRAQVRGAQPALGEVAERPARVDLLREHRLPLAAFCGAGPPSRAAGAGAARAAGARQQQALRSTGGGRARVRGRRGSGAQRVMRERPRARGYVHSRVRVAGLRPPLTR
mmetsp:Transcript_48106/g.135900  ORF Transcript_48106/g.135900 Transcript_48106/m.135900 type:complete len:208 (-) Transcript_48106:669-1292(-)